MYRVEVDWAPAYELLISLYAYVGTSDRQIMDLGPEWLKSVRQQIGPELAAELASYRNAKALSVPNVLVRLCPGERDAEGFLRWLSGFSAGALYEMLAPHLRDDQALMFRNLPAMLERAVPLLAAWNERYFRHLDPAILQGLAADAAAKRALMATLEAPALVELATVGIDYRPQREPQTVLLVPQYHYRPWNLHALFAELKVYEYPVDALPVSPEDPPPALLRLTRALADENRLRILRFLATGPRSFMDVAGYAELAKSTVHHHMVVLRASGLICVHDADNGPPSYSLRPSGVTHLAARLETFLHH